MHDLLQQFIVLMSVIVCAVPERYRRSWPITNPEDLRGPAIASGVLEFLLSAPGTLFYVAVVMGGAKAGYGVAGFYHNPFIVFPFTFAEGAVRFLAALTGGQIFPTLPLGIIAWIHDRLEDKANRRRLGPPVIDKVERGDGNSYNLRVSSCRQKAHWNPYMTIRFENEFYQMFREEVGKGIQPFVYLLRKHPVGRVVVVVYEYRREDVLHPEAEPKRWRRE